MVYRSKRNIQRSIETELDQKLFAYAAEGKIDKFDKFFAHKGVICVQKDDVTFQEHFQVELVEWCTRLCVHILI